MVFDRIREAAAEIQGEFVPGLVWPEDDALQPPYLDAKPSLEVDGRRFWVLFDSEWGSNSEACTLFFPFPEYPAALEDTDLMGLLDACQYARLAIGRDSGAAAHDRAFLIGLDYPMPSEGITGRSLRWVLDNLVADAERVELVLAEQIERTLELGDLVSC